MANRASVEKLIEDMHAMRAAKDLDAIERVFKPDAVFQLVGSPATFPGAGRAEGHDQLRASIGLLIAAFDFVDRTMVASVIEDDKAAVHWRLKVKYNPTGEVFETEIFELWTFDHGRVASLVQFCDTALVASVMARK
jgi:ketosteroid isomerase-like protein